MAPIPDVFTVKQAADEIRVSEGTIYRWITQGKIIVRREGRNILIPTDDNLNFFVGQIRSRYQRPGSAWVPEEIKVYSDWHQLLDELTWLLKVCYSPREDIKRKQFRLDQLFANYIKFHKIELPKIKRIFPGVRGLKRRLITDDLKRGWYNELAFILPLKKSTLGLTFADIELNKATAQTRFAFPSWRITSAYYAVYFYLRAVTLQKHSTFRIQEHGSTISCFKYNLLQPFERVIWKFPFDIAYKPGVRVDKQRLLSEQLPYLVYGYARHPRTPNRTPTETFDFIYRTFRKYGKRWKKPGIYTLFDYFHDFRVWANYLDIDNLLSLRGSGYKSFIDQNLSVILFFIGGFTELCYIAVFGVRRYVAQLQSFYDLFAVNNPELESDFVNTSVYQRLLIYNELNIIDEHIKLTRHFNINAINLSST